MSNCWFNAGLWGLISLITISSALGLQPTGSVSGTVVAAHGPVAEARVRVRATDWTDITDSSGAFTLEGIPSGMEVEITAWAPGFYIASEQVISPAENVVITLRPYHTQDHPAYAWTLPEGEANDGESSACGTCHPMIIEQWQRNAHGSAISNPRFFSLYNGSDLAGSGYLLDFPGTAGTCANCHAPGAAVDGYLTTNMNAVRGQVEAGIHCDFCHKVGGVYLNPADVMPYANVPGVQAMRVLRPPEGDNIFFGPYDDIHDPDTYLPQMAESAFCATCHQFSMWGTPIYTSYNEWLNSPYADMGMTCQDCHMPPTGDEWFALPEVGGLRHPPETIPSHLQLGATDTEFLQTAVTVEVEVTPVNNQIAVNITIMNSATGHHIPTDFPGRQMILVVEATDSAGHSLRLDEGPVIPAWGGPEAGRPGKAYAKILREIRTGIMPTVAYWNPTQIVSDNRLPAFGNDESHYLFAAESSQTVNVRVYLLFRRVFYEEGRRRGWDIPDVMMCDHAVSVGLN